MNIDIGPGRFPYKDWVTVDAFGEPDVKANMWDLPFEDNSITNIHCSHALEHVYKHQVMPTLREWNRVLMPNGKLILEVPDLGWCLRKWLENPTNEYELDCIFGMQSYDGWITHEGEIHRTGFSKELLKANVEVAGFKVLENKIIWSHNMDTISMLARKI